MASTSGEVDLMLAALQPEVSHVREVGVWKTLGPGDLWPSPTRGQGRWMASTSGEVDLMLAALQPEVSHVREVGVWKTLGPGDLWPSPTRGQGRWMASTSGEVDLMLAALGEEVSQYSSYEKDGENFDPKRRQSQPALVQQTLQNAGTLSFMDSPKDGDKSDNILAGIY